MTRPKAVEVVHRLNDIEEMELFIEEIEKVLKDFALGSNFENKLSIFLEEELSRRNQILADL